MTPARGETIKPDGTMSIEPDVLNGVRRATERGGWTTEHGVTFGGAPFVRIVGGPGGRGVKRHTWLIVGGDTMTLADCYRALAVCLERVS